MRGNPKTGSEREDSSTNEPHEVRMFETEVKH